MEILPRRQKKEISIEELVEAIRDIANCYGLTYFEALETYKLFEKK